MLHHIRIAPCLLVVAAITGCATASVRSGGSAPPPAAGGQPAASPSSTPAERPIAKPVAPDPTEHPEAYSPLVAPPPFDPAAYAKDPKAYVQQVVPARCWQTAQPAANVKMLEPIGGTGYVVETGKRCTFTARTEPGMPVSFTSFGLGAFTDSGVSAVTVQANAEGIATAEFAITPGTVGTCEVVAGSPSRAGTISYMVRIPSASAKVHQP